MLDWTDTEFLKPMVNAWMGKLDAAYRSDDRRHFVDVAEECKMFYARSCASLWNSKWASKFLNNVIERPRFPISVNKAFELVAVIGPNVLWDMPFRQVRPKQQMTIPDEAMQIIMQDPQAAQMMPYLQQMDQQDVASAQVTASLMETWLNYTSREMPDGGMTEHAQTMAIDAMLTGRGVRFVRSHQYPGSEQKIIGSFREDPLDVVWDPDVKHIKNAKWMALKHRDPYWEVERKFKLPKDSLRRRATLESSWSYAETAYGHSESTAQPRISDESDIVVWYEIWSKMGSGCQSIQMQDGLKQKFQEVVGDYCYLAMASNLPYPLNCTSDKMRGRMSDDEVRQTFSWPTPMWAAGRWPCEVLDYYTNPDSLYPVAPLEPGMGYLKFLNLMLPFLAQRTWSSSRDFWAVLSHQMDQYEKYINNGKDQCIIPVDPSVEDVRKSIQIIQQPQVNMDAWKITDVTAEAFERATGLSAFQYGMKGKESNDRSAAETQARAKHAGVRPEYMQKRHRECEGNIASHEAILSHWFIDGNDVRPLGGATMQWGWERYVMMTQITNVIWGMSYDITASSIRRPDREMEAARWDRALDVLGPNYFSYGMASADFTGWNSLIENWAENMDTMQGDIDSLMIRPPQQEGPSEEEQQQAAMEQAKTEADLQGKQMDLQGKQMDLAGKEMDLQGKVAQSQLDMQGQAAQSMFQQRDMATKTLAEMRKAEIDMAKNSRALEFAQRKQVTDLAGQEANAAIDISHKLALNRIQRARAKAGSNGDERKE